jgi:nicotinamide phosphoribosyltransferase
LNAIDLWTLPQRGQKSLTDQVKEAGATVVLRPDSGHPVDMPVLVVDTLLRRLRKEGKVNEKGFAVLPDHVRVIQGDGIDMQDVKNILDKLIAAKNSTENIGFGMGGGLLQKCDRDTFKFAMKCNAIEIDGEWRAVFKDPITDKGKASKRGRQVLLRHKETKEFVTVRVELGADLRLGGWISATEVMFSSYAGTTKTNFTTLDKIRERAAL